jgi:hypothetical protein
MGTVPIFGPLPMTLGHPFIRKLGTVPFYCSTEMRNAPRLARLVVEFV